MDSAKSDIFDFYFNATRETIDRAKELRKTMTKAEAILWEKLRNRRLSGLKFRRQHPIEIFIADFFCPEKMLVIEVDGGIHQTKEQKEWDRNRAYEIEKYGIKIIRFTNEDVENDIIKVLMTIKKACFNSSPLTPSPRWRGAGGEVKKITL